MYEKFYFNCYDFFLLLKKCRKSNEKQKCNYSVILIKAKTLRNLGIYFIQNLKILETLESSVLALILITKSYNFLMAVFE